MSVEEIRKSVLLHLYWLGFITAVLVCVLANLLPFQLAFVAPENLFLCLIEAEIFFVLVLWPLFLPALLRRGAERMGRKVGDPMLFVQVILLMIFAFPLALVCVSVSGTEVGFFFRAQLLVAVLALFVAALYSLSYRLGRSITVWYYLAFFVLSAVVPFLYFLVREHGAEGFEFLSYVSPFWAALEPGTAVVHAIILGAAAVGVVAVLSLLRRPTAPSTGELA